jgi:hypothetical protein
MFLIRLAAKVLLFMIALPALGLVTFTGGIWTGLGAALLVSIVGAFAVIPLLPLLAVVGVASATGGRLGLMVGSFVIGTIVDSVAIGLVAWMLGGLALIGFWPTVFAGAILGAVNALFASPKQSK